MNTTTFGIAVPQHLGPDGFDPAALRSYLQRAEALGFAGAWVSEQVVGTAPLLAPLEMLALAAGCTSRLRLGTSALISTVHSPLHLAHSVATLDQISGGRVELGVAGGGPRRPFAAYGMTADGHVGRFVEGVELIKAAWREGPVTFDGRWFRADGLPVEPKPVQRPHPPLWMGGSHPSALRRAVRLADGFFGAGSTTTEAFARQVQLVGEALAGSGRDPAGFRSPSASTSRSTTTRSAPGPGSVPPSTACTAGSGCATWRRRWRWPAPRRSASRVSGR